MSTGDPFHDLIQDGKAAYKRGAFEDAARMFRAARDLQPDSLSAVHKLAITLLNLRQFDEAERVWQRVIALAPQIAEPHHVLGKLYTAQGRADAGMAHFQRALDLQPKLPGVALKIAQWALARHDLLTASRYFVQALEREPKRLDVLINALETLNDTHQAARAVSVGAAAMADWDARSDIDPFSFREVHMLMADAYKQLNDLPRAAQFYRALVARIPEDHVTRHLLAAAEGQASDTYAKDFALNIFDHMAATFDTRLVEILKYRSPETLAAGLADIHLGEFARVLDLGCGTGLMGAALKHHFQVGRIVGVDLSPNMIEEARKRGIYDELICGDIAKAMQTQDNRFDLVLAADVFIYVGELSQVFARAKALLASGGLFAFTVEAGTGAEVELTPHAHYRHTGAYIARLAADNGLTIVRQTDAPIRQERGVDVMGAYFYLRA